MYAHSVWIDNIFWAGTAYIANYNKHRGITNILDEKLFYNSKDKFKPRSQMSFLSGVPSIEIYDFSCSFSSQRCIINYRKLY